MRIAWNICLKWLLSVIQEITVLYRIIKHHNNQTSDKEITQSLKLNINTIGGAVSQSHCYVRLRPKQAGKKRKQQQQQQQQYRLEYCASFIISYFFKVELRQLTVF